MLDHTTLAKAVFESLEEKGWLHLTLHDVAQKADVSLEDLHQFATMKEDLILLTIPYIEGKDSEDQAGEGSLSGDDLLFEALFSRFEAAEHHKKAIHLFYNDMKGTPTELRPFVAPFLEALKRLGHGGGLDFDGPLGVVQLRLFALIYLRLVSVWLADDSPDLAKTMAETNKAVTKYIPCLFEPQKIMELF